MKYIIFIIIVILLIRFRNIPEWIWYNNPVRSWLENRKYKNAHTIEDDELILSDDKKERKKYVKHVLGHIPTKIEVAKLQAELYVTNVNYINFCSFPQIIVYDDAEKEFSSDLEAYSDCVHYTWAEYKKINPPQGMKLPVMNYNKAKSNGAL